MNQAHDPGGITGGEDSHLSRKHGHDLKNIFSIIIANAQMIGDELPAGDQTGRRLERIVAACRRGEALVGHIRNPGSGEAGQMGSPMPEPAAPAPVPGRILVVDDEKDVVEILRRSLAKAGYQVLGMTDGTQALARFAAEPSAFALLITDLDMPNMSGFALCTAIHAIRPDLPTIMITGYDRDISEEQFAGLGINEMLTKPVNRQHFLAVVHRLLAA